MEDKPLTALTVLPPLEVIPWRPLPTHRTKELALLRQETAEALWEVNKTNIITIGCVFFDLLSIAGFFLALVPMSPWAILLGLASVVLTILTVMMGQISARETRIWRELDSQLPQLQLDARAEAALPIVLKKINEDVVNWNKYQEILEQQDQDELSIPSLNLKPLNKAKEVERLNKSREEISARKELFLKVASAVARKGK